MQTHKRNPTIRLLQFFCFWTSTHCRLLGASEELKATNEVKKEHQRGRGGRCKGEAEGCKDTAARQEEGWGGGGVGAERISEGGTHEWMGGCCIYFSPCDSGTAASSMRHNKRKMETKQRHFRLLFTHVHTRTHTLGLLRFKCRELKHLLTFRAAGSDSVCDRQGDYLRIQ